MAAAGLPLWRLILAADSRDFRGDGRPSPFLFMGDGAQTAMTIETERLILRPLASSDATRLTQLAGDIGVARMTMRMPHPYTFDNARSFIGAARKSPVFAITLSKRIIGCIGIHSENAIHPENDGNAELGYWIGKSWWGQGFATEAVREMVRHGFFDLHLDCIKAGHFTDNPASGRVLQKCGFRIAGQSQRFCVARDAEVACEDYVLDRGTAERQGLI